MGKVLKIQSFVYKRCLAEGNLNWHLHLKKRLNTLSPGTVFNGSTASANFCRHLAGKTFDMKVILCRSMCNGWATSDRYHEHARHLCFFGCNMLQPKPRDYTPSLDILSHYFVCPHLLFIIQSLFKYYDIYAPMELMHFTPTDRHREVYIMHYIYHFLKAEHLTLVSNINSLNKVARIFKICFKYGESLILKDFPDIVHSDSSSWGRPGPV